MVYSFSSSRSQGGAFLSSSSTGIIRRRHHHHQPPKTNNIICSVQTFLLSALIVLVLLYYKVTVYLLGRGGGGGEEDQRNSDGVASLFISLQQQQQHVHELQQQGLVLVPTNPLYVYQDWREYAVQLAALPPHKIVETLKVVDPFGVRTFEQKLLELESQKQAFLTLEELQSLFPCPSLITQQNLEQQQQKQQRITLPDQRNTDKAKAFRNHTEPYFLFFQHLRKAGGTNFCTLAQNNLPKKQVPRYFCMPDYHWEVPGQQRPCAGCLSRFDTTFITNQMKRNKHKIIGNEWDPFDGDHYLDELPAIFATSFRKPLDRALSQFRFECIEERGCKIKNITQWWNKRSKDLTNVYVWTFTNQGVRKASIGTSHQDAKRRQYLLGKALDVVAKFNLVMVMEWLAYAPTHVQNVLGFHHTATLTERVRPHIGQAQREDGQEHNVLGAAGIAKASWTPESYLPPALYTRMSHDLALDEILTDAARRIFLERVVCKDVSKFD